MSIKNVLSRLAFQIDGRVLCGWVNEGLDCFIKDFEFPCWIERNYRGTVQFHLFGLYNL